MRKLLTLCLLLGAMAAHADTPSDVTYVGGTLAAPAPGAAATLDFASPDALLVHAGTATVTIPWASITEWGCYRQNRHELGVLPVIAAGLVAAREHNHYFHLAWNDEQGRVQAILIQVPGSLSKTIHVVLDAHAPAQHERTVPPHGVPE
jgi:hypothetical protein